MARILVVENDFGNVEVIRLILQEEQHEVITIQQSGLLAHTIGMFAPELIIMDIVLDNADGRLLCNNLISQTATSHIPVLLITAMMESNARSVACFADHLMFKPFDYSTFSNRVSFMIN